MIQKVWKYGCYVLVVMMIAVVTVYAVEPDTPAGFNSLPCKDRIPMAELPKECEGWWVSTWFGKKYRIELKWNELPSKHEDMNLYQFDEPVWFSRLNDLSSEKIRTTVESEAEIERTQMFLCVGEKASRMIQAGYPEGGALYFCGKPKNWQPGRSIHVTLGRNYRFLLTYKPGSHLFSIPGGRILIEENWAPMQKLISAGSAYREDLKSYCRSRDAKNYMDRELNILKCELDRQ